MKGIPRVWLFGIVLALPGCYSHAVIPVAEAPVGADVRARVSVAEADRLAGVLGGEYRVLQGEVVDQSPDGLLLEVPLVAGRSGQRLRQRVTIPGSEILELEMRRVDVWRTAALVAVAAAAGGVLVATQFDHDDRSDSAAPPKGGADQVLVPLLRWVW